MKRKAGAMVLLAALGGWGSQAAWAGGFMSQYWNNTPDGVRTGAYTTQAARLYMYATGSRPFGEPTGWSEQSCRGSYMLLPVHRTAT